MNALQAVLGKEPTIWAVKYSLDPNFVWIGNEYCAFEYHLIARSDFANIAGVYIFAKEVTGDEPDHTEWQAFYIGEAEDLGASLWEHPAWEQAERLGATHVLLQIEDDAFSRRLEKRTWIDYLSPSLNKATLT